MPARQVCYSFCVFRFLSLFRGRGLDRRRNADVEDGGLDVAVLHSIIARVLESARIFSDIFVYRIFVVLCSIGY